MGQTAHPAKPQALGKCNRGRESQNEHCIGTHRSIRIFPRQELSANPVPILACRLSISIQPLPFFWRPGGRLEALIYNETKRITQLLRFLVCLPFVGRPIIQPMFLRGNVAG